MQLGFEVGKWIGRNCKQKFEGRFILQQAGDSVLLCDLACTDGGEALQSIKEHLSKEYTIKPVDADNQFYIVSPDLELKS